MVRSRSSCSKTKRSFSSITLLVFHGMRLFYTQLPKFCSVRDAPGLICQGCARSVPQLYPTPSPFFVSADSKAVTGRASVSAESKELICTKIVQNLSGLGTAYSKGFRCGEMSVRATKKRQLPAFDANLSGRDCN